MIVTRTDLEAQLDRVRAAVSDPAGGIYGPRSAAWQLQRELLIFLGGGRAVLLQLAHPFVAYAIDEHSATRGDVLGRFQRTFDHVFAMSFGPLDAALAAARQVHAVHTRIHGVIPVDVGAWPAGTRYLANDSESLRWVYATLVHTVVHVRQLVLGRIAPALRDAYVRDTWQFARLFGIPEALLPRGWDELDGYVAEMTASPRLTVSEPAREMARFLFGAVTRDGAPARRRPVAGRWLERMSAAMLPPRLREGFGLSWGARDRAAVAASVAALRAGYPLIPRPLRYLPAYQAATRRLAGLPPTRTTRWMEQRLQLLAQLATG